MMYRVAVLVLSLTAAANAVRSGGAPLPGRPLVELKPGIIAPFDPANCQVSLTLEGAATDVHGNPAELTVSLRSAGGTWASGQAECERWRGKRFAADVKGLKLEGDRLRGQITVDVKDKNKKNLTLAYTVDARVGDTVTGTHAGSADAAGAKGKVTGKATRARRIGLFDRGRLDGGLRLDLDMGTKRVNWNHHRSAHIEFAEARDLSASTGLRVRVATDRPRDDASVTVWLAEADGSWYHVKDAVPLVAQRNEAVVRFSDFVLAEWVAPSGFHLDEDYVLDLKSIKALAVGVINPLGVGVVSFTVTALDVVEEDLPKPGTVTLGVTGKTLSVNGHNVVPAGIFGGYARDLPQEYRPGCQRGLYPSTQPRIPRQTFVQFKEGREAPEWPKVVEKLRGEVGKRLMGLVDEPDIVARFERLRPPKAGDKRAKQMPRELANLLNHLLHKPLEQPGPKVRNHTELMERNRRLLEATFPELPKVSEGRPTEAFYIDCYGERKERAVFLTRADWREHLDTWGRAFAANAKASGCLAVFEFWNEPYLNWAERSWVHYLPDPYKVEKAVDGGPVAVKRSSSLTHSQVRDWAGLANAFRQGREADKTDPRRRLYDKLDRRVKPRLDGQRPDRSLQQAMLRALNDLIRRKGIGPKTDDKPDRATLERRNRAILGAKLPGLFAPDPASGPDEIIPHFKWKKIPSGWRVVDETAFTFWSGKGNGYIYDSMLAVVGKAIKETHAGVPVFGGWGFRWNEDHWAGWRLLYKPTIDRNIGWIDGVHEHHYMGDPIGMHGTYEVVATYGMTAHGKWLYSINTETNDLLDTPAVGRVDNPEKRQRSKEYRQMVYNMRDCLYGVMQSPDKLYGRTMIHAYKAPEATRVAYGMMKDLRGRLVETASPDRDLWVVASVDGTDPKAMPPQPGQTLVVRVLNDAVAPRDVALNIDAPKGTRFKGGTTERNTVDWGTFAVDVKTEKVEASGTKARFEFRLDGKLAWKVSLLLEGEIVRQEQVQRHQFFSKDIIQRVRPGEPFATMVTVDAKALDRAKRARLRLVVEGLARSEGTVAVNGKAIALPEAYTQDNVTRIVELPVDLAALKPTNAIAFTLAPDHAGYQVDMTSIVLEDRDD